MAGQNGITDRDRLALSPYLNIDSGALSTVLLIYILFRIRLENI